MIDFKQTWSSTFEDSELENEYIAYFIKDKKYIIMAIAILNIVSTLMGLANSSTITRNEF